MSRTSCADGRGGVIPQVRLRKARRSAEPSSSKLPEYRADVHHAVEPVEARETKTCALHCLLALVGIRRSSPGTICVSVSQATQPLTPAGSLGIAATSRALGVLAQLGTDVLMRSEAVAAAAAS